MYDVHYNRPLPEKIIAEIIKFRITENMAEHISAKRK